MWHATKSAQAEAVRTCFRIVPPTDEGEERADPANVPARSRRRNDHLARFGAGLAHRFRPPGGRRPEPRGFRRGRLVRRARTDRHRAPRRAPRRAPSARPRSGRPSRPCAGKDTVLGDPLRLHHGRCGHPDLPSRGRPSLGRGRIRRTRAPMVALVEDQARTAAQGADQLEGWDFHRHHRPRRTVRHPLGGRAGRRHLERDRAPPAGSAEAAARACARPMGRASSRGALGRHHRGREAGHYWRRPVRWRGPAVGARTRARSGRTAGRRRGGGRLARPPALRCRRPNARAHADARRFRRRAPPLSRTRARLAELLG